MQNLSVIEEVVHKHAFAAKAQKKKIFQHANAECLAVAYWQLQNRVFAQDNSFLAQFLGETAYSSPLYQHMYITLHTGLAKITIYI